MILTVTANPTIDRVLFVRDFHMQDVVRAEREVVSPSGKGIDVSLILHAFGAKTVALGLRAGHSGQILAQLLDEQGVGYDFVTANGETRTAALITDVADHRQSTILAHTLTAHAAHLTQLLARVTHYAGESWGLVCAGSLPPGLPPDSFAQILAEANRHHLVTLLDSSGVGLSHGIDGLPYILKINGAELAGLSPQIRARWQTAGSEPHADGVPGDLHVLAWLLAGSLGAWAQQAIVITLGKRGVLAVTTEGNWYAPALIVPVVSPAGAGDAVSAGLMLARRRGQDRPEALALGVAAAAAVVMNPGTAVCTQQEVETLLPQVVVTELKAE